MPATNTQWITPEDEHRTCPKHVDFRTRKNLEISASVGFCCKEIFIVNVGLHIYTISQFKIVYMFTITVMSITIDIQQVPFEKSHTGCRVGRSSNRAGTTQQNTHT